MGRLAEEKTQERLWKTQVQKEGEIGAGHVICGKESREKKD